MIPAVNLSKERTILWADYERVCRALVRVTMSTWHYTLDESELLSIGRATFVQCIAKWDSEVGVSFGYYYHSALRHEISKHINKMKIGRVSAC